MAKTKTDKTKETINSRVVRLNVDLLNIIQEYEDETGFMVDRVVCLHVPIDGRDQTVNASAQIKIIY